MKKWRFHKVLFWVGLAGAVTTALLACDPQNLGSGIGMGLAALAFLKASEIVSKENVKVDEPLEPHTKGAPPD